MADEADIAQARMEAELERNLAGRRWNMLPITGHCWNCEEAIEGARFCDKACAEDWDLREAANKRNGRG